MFWVKDVDGSRVPLDSGNIYTTCPGCGQEFNVTINDLAWFINEIGAASGMWCGECGEGGPGDPPRPRLQVIRGGRP